MHVSKKNHNILTHKIKFINVEFTSKDIKPDEIGRVEHSGSSWQARSEGGQIILKGQQAKIVGRDNITWIVQKI